LKQNDPRRGVPRIVLLVAVLLVVMIVVALHLAGVVGPGSG
jgi:hypothetical protein